MSSKYHLYRVLNIKLINHWLVSFQMCRHIFNLFSFRSQFENCMVLFIHFSPPSSHSYHFSLIILRQSDHVRNRHNCGWSTGKLLSSIRNPVAPQPSYSSFLQGESWRKFSSRIFSGTPRGADFRLGFCFL